MVLFSTTSTVLGSPAGSEQTNICGRRSDSTVRIHVVLGLPVPRGRFQSFGGTYVSECRARATHIYSIDLTNNFLHLETIKNRMSRRELEEISASVSFRPIHDLHYVSEYYRLN